MRTWRTPKSKGLARPEHSGKRVTLLIIFPLREFFITLVLEMTFGGIKLVPLYALLGWLSQELTVVC